MTTGSRVAAQYRHLSTADLRHVRTHMRNARRQAAVDLILSERQEAYQAAFDGAQRVLDAIGGADLPKLHERALDTAKRHAEMVQHLEFEQAMGVADAFWDYIRERSDT